MNFSVAGNVVGYSSCQNMQIVFIIISIETGEFVSVSALCVVESGRWH